MEGGGWDGRTAGRRRGPALNFSASNGVARDTRRDPHFGADPQFDNRYIFSQPVPLPAKRSSPAVGGGRAGLHGNGWDCLGLNGMGLDEKRNCGCCTVASLSCRDGVLSSQPSKGHSAAGIVSSARSLGRGIVAS